MWLKIFLCSLLFRWNNNILRLIYEMIFLFLVSYGNNFILNLSFKPSGMDFTSILSQKKDLLK